MSNNVSYTFENGIASIAMDDGKANALSHQMWDELEEAFNQAETDNAIVIFKWRPGLFSGGFDLKEISKGPKKALLLSHLKNIHCKIFLRSMSNAFFKSKQLIFLSVITTMKLKMCSVMLS